MEKPTNEKIMYTDAQTILINGKQKELQAYAYLLTKDYTRARDLSQDTNVRILKAFANGTYKEEGYFLTYAKTVLHNLFIDRNRRKNETVYYDMRKFEIAVEQKETLTKEEIINVLNSITIEEIKDVFILRIFYNMKYERISKLMSCSINTSLGRMRYAMKKIKAN